MNLIAALEKKHSVAIKNRIMKYVGTDPKRFRQLMELFAGDNPRHVQWAGWALSDLVKVHPELIKPYLRSLLKKLDTSAHISVKRNVMRLLQFVDIPTTMAGLVFDKAFTLFTDPSESIAVKVFSMTALRKVAVAIPELKKEVIVVIEDQYEYGSAAFRSRARRELKILRSKK